MKKEIEIVITSLYRPFTYQKRFSIWQIRMMIIAVIFFTILAALGIYLLHYTNQQNVTIQYLYKRNQQLESEMKKISELQSRLQTMELERIKIAKMLGADKNPPPIDLSSLEEVYTPYDTGQKLVASESLFAPTVGFIISQRFSQTHTGIDLAAQLGMPVFAVKAGIIEDVGVDTFSGHFMRIKPNDDYETFYGHLYKFIKSKNENVSAGDILGYVGSSGKSTAPHLHFELRLIRDGRSIPLDPEKELKLIFSKK
ncbi:MAG: M23 family metallopeptidase [candidate division WOR-3 bacterium]|nr:M23 family metallopeptidase [candidate division WOR-3 bacterium]